jgi:ferredoxin
MSDEDALPPAPPVKVRAHHGICEGWGECHRAAPDIYPLDAEGHIDIHVMDVPGEHAEDAWWAANACPVQAITVVGPPREYWYERSKQRRALEQKQRAEQERATSAGN